MTCDAGLMGLPAHHLPFSFLQPGQVKALHSTAANPIFTVYLLQSACLGVQRRQEKEIVIFTSKASHRTYGSVDRRRPVGGCVFLSKQVPPPPKERGLTPLVIATISWNSTSPWSWCYLRVRAIALGPISSVVPFTATAASVDRTPSRQDECSLCS